MTESQQPRPALAKDEVGAELDALRERIDALDREILGRLNERARVAQQVGALKQRVGLPVYQPARESELLARLVAINPGPFPSAALAPVFREIISATRALEHPVRVAYLGPEGTYSHLAARERFGALADFAAVGSIPEVFAAVERGRAELGVVPAENTTEGVVTQTLDTIAESELTICGELLLRISHHLLSRSGRREDVRRVASIPQALAQCRGWLERVLPGIERAETPSTAAAARLAAQDGGVAAIASPIAAEVYGLATIEARIEDRRDNTTRFLVIGREAPPPSGNDLTSAVFVVRKDQSGALHRLLEPFAAERVNLTAIQSRPIKGKPWEYLFFVDLEGHRAEERVARALAEAASRAHSHRILGSYPRANPRPRAARAGG